MKLYDFAVVGAGAAGLTAAISAKRAAPKRNVLVLERLPRVGKKIAATGNGRCNLANRNISADYYHGKDPSFVIPVFQSVPLRALLSFFDSIGVPVVFEGDRAYPMSLQAGSVVDALRFEAQEAGVEVRCDQHVTRLEKKNDAFFMQAGDTIAARSVLVAAGGCAAPHLGSDGSGYALLQAFGHRLRQPKPALTQVLTEREYVRQLKGVKVDCAAAVRVGGVDQSVARGEVLFCDYGLSGPPVLQLSRLVSQNPQSYIKLDLLPDLTQPAVRSLCAGRMAAHPNRPCGEFFTGMLSKRLGQVLMKFCNVPLDRPACALTEETLDKLSRTIKCFVLKTHGTAGFQHAQATAGGIETEGFDSNTMMSKRTRGLFAAGEVLDIDGDCGGYNLAWAWAGGILAGHSAMAFLEAAE